MIVLIAAALVVTLMSTAYLLYSRLGAQSQPAFDPVADYLATPEQIPARVGAVATELTRLDVTRGGLEIYDAAGQRHSITPNGEWLERGGSSHAGPGFALADVDFTKLPQILAAATGDGGGNPNSAHVELFEGVPSWRIVVWAEGGARELIYSLDGVLLRKS